jgi:carboxyl-terminal processing protease
MNKRTLPYIAIFLVVLFGSVAFSVSSATDQPEQTGIASANPEVLATPAPSNTDAATSSEHDDVISRDMDRIETLYRAIDAVSLYEIDHDQIYTELAEALFNAHEDPYASYITEEQSRDLTDQAQGVYGGIGAYISKPNPDTIDPDDPKTYMVTIVSPFRGAPAYHADLHAGDLISHIDGEDVSDLNAEEASNMLRGEPGTPVRLKVHRGKAQFEITVTREIVEIPTVEYDMIGDIGYVRILEFTSLTGRKVEEAIRDLIHEGGFSSLILDLRSNPGGVVDSSQQIADMFLSGKTIFTFETNDESETKVIKAQKQTLVPETLPLVVLIDGGSASASEILAGALKDNDRAVIIGTTSFGKGLVQQIYPYGKDFFKLTIARYLTPDNHDINELGIDPDILVEEAELSDEQMEDYADLIERQVFVNFVDEHPEEDPETTQAFVQSLLQEGVTLPERYLYRFVKMQYERRMDFPPVYDLDFDIVLNRAIEYLRTGGSGE